jgi:hypothetical protein
VAGKIVYLRGMEEASENGKELSHPAHASGMNERGGEIAVRKLV